MRCFLAIDLSEEARQTVANLQMHLRAGRKVPEENLHLTLAFLDDQPDGVLQALHARLSNIEFDPFAYHFAVWKCLGASGHVSCT